MGDAAIALQRPGGTCRRLHVLGLHSVHCGDASAQHRNAFEFGLRRPLRDECIEAFGVGRLDVDEVERGRIFRQRRDELTAQIAVDQDHRDENCKAQSERQHDGRRQCAGPVDVGDRQPQRSRARPRQTRSHGHQQHGDQSKRRKYRGRRRHKDEGDPAVIGQEHGERGEDGDDQDCAGDVDACAAIGAPARLRRGTVPRPGHHGCARAATTRRRAPSAGRRWARRRAHPAAGDGSIGSGMTAPKPQATRNGKLAPSASPITAPISASTNTCAR